MERPPADPAKLLSAWTEWETGETPPGRVMSNLKTGGMRDVLDHVGTTADVAPEGVQPAEALDAWMGWETGQTAPGPVMTALHAAGVRALLEHLSGSGGGRGVGRRMTDLEPGRLARSALLAAGVPAPTQPADPTRGGPQRIPRPPGAAPGAPAPWADLPDAVRRPSVEDVRRALAAIGPAELSPVERDGFASARLPSELRGALGRDARPAVPSAVLAPLYDRDGEAHVVLTRRGRHMRAHAGEVSFPGGRADATDHDLVATALREAEEEVGLPPSAVEVIGELDHLATVTSGAFIVPWIGLIPSQPELRPASPEVDAVLHVPLSELMAPGVYREERWTFAPGISRPIVFFDLVGDTVWGATAAMLRQLLGFVTGTVGRGELDHD